MRVLLFAQVRDTLGLSEMELKCAGSVDAARLWELLIAAEPRLGPFRSSVRLARNCEYAGPETRFADTDEVALIPPVSGG